MVSYNVLTFTGIIFHKNWLTYPSISTIHNGWIILEYQATESWSKKASSQEEPWVIKNILGMPPFQIFF